MRTVVVRNPNFGKSEKHVVSCLQMNRPLPYYEELYEVVTVVNKLANPYHIHRIQRYFLKRIPN